MSGSTSYTATINVQAQIESAVANIKKILTELDKLKLAPNLRTSFDTNFKNLYKEIEKYLDIIARGPKTKVDSSALERSGNNILKIYNLIVKEMNSLDGSTLKNAFKDIGALEVEKLKTEFENLKKTLGEVTAKSDFGKNLTSSFEDARKKLEDLNNEATQLVNKLGKTTFKTFSNNLFSGRFDLAENNLKSILELINKLGESVLGKLELVEWANNLSKAFELLKNSGDISSFTEKLNELKGTLSSKLADVILQLINNFSNLKDIAAGTGNELERITKDTIQLTNAQVLFNNEIGQLKSRIQYFFGLANAINLVKRAVRSSFNTVKELDKAMTETAVVTNYTIKDMWKQLPEYTKRANLLGVTTKAAYESATLYYQQGLNTELAAALSTETLKMARIAGLDAADATDRMTNALRGFNMELNATLAQRVDDVYSQLAAMSASNVDEISTAMTKVASLANNANMKFETTAAFLAQIIETTRESAETAGTALKTVVARFSEVKKLVDTNLLKGLDEEGQVIDVNKVSTALRTAGIDLNKYFLGEVGLDDIFMELSEKWDSLTNIQLRYIATLAAGSRQQSRFIALMQDYSRTLELVGAAYSSTGASQKQFEKTLDSMESKLARLKNAWDEFAMGLANNAVLKGAVDVLTNILQLVNKITNAFGDGVGSIMKWGALIGSLAGVRGIFKNGGFIDKAAGSFLNNTALGNILFKGGVLSGNLFGGMTAADSTARRTVEEAARLGTRSTIVTTGGLRGLFGNFRQRRAARLEAFNTYSAARGTVLDSNEFYNDLPRIGKLGLKASNNKLLGGISKKLAGTKFASGLGKLLGFGGTAEAATAAAGLAVSLGAVAAAAGAVAIAYKAWYDLSPEGQLKLATEWAETMDKVSENAEKAKNSTKEAYEGYQEKNKAVETADTAISKQKAISERNLFINDLLLKDNTYAQYLKTSFDKESGQLTLSIDEADLKKVAENAEAGAIKAAASASLALAMKAGKLANVYEALMQRAGANIITKTIIELTETGTVTRAMTPDEITKYLNLLLKQSQQKAAMEAYAKSAYAGMIDSKTLGSEMADLVAGLLAKTFDEDEYLKEVKKGRTLAATYEGEEGAAIWWLRGKGYWRKRYLEVYGYEPEKDLSGALLATAVGEALALLGLEDKAASVSRLALNSLYETLFKALNGEIDIGLWEDTELYINKFKNLLDVLAEDMGYDADKLANILRLNAKTEKELQKSNLVTLSTKGKKAGAKAETLLTLLGANKEDIAKIINFSDAAEKSLGEGFGKFLDDIPLYIKDGLLDNLGEFFKSFDLDSPISAFKKLKTISLDTKDPLQSLAKEILNINSSTFDLGYLTLVFMTSEAYEGINENLEKFIEDNKEITAENINELAESCSDLKTLINEADISALSLARAFTAVASGEASIDGITSAVLETLGATLSASTAIDKLFKTIDEFDAGRDFGKAVDFAMSKIGELEKSLENLDFGNETFKKNYKYFFTDEDYKDFIAKDTAGRKTMLEGLINRVKGLLDNDALGAMRALAGINGSGVTGDINGFDFTWDVQNWTWDDAVGKILEYLNVNEQVASTILTAAAKHIPGLTELLDLNGFEKDITLFNLKISQLALVTELELLVLAKAYGKDVELLWKDLQNNAKKNGIELPARISWQDDNGNNLTGKELLDKARLTYNTDKFKIDAVRSRQVYNEDGSAMFGGFDPTKLTNAILNSLKVNAALAREIANDYVKSVNGLFELSVLIPFKVVNEDGSETWDLRTEILKDSTLEGLEALVKLKEDQALWAAYGEAMKTAITEALGNIKPGGNADKVISDIKTLLATYTFTVNVKGNYVGTESAPGSNSSDNTSRGNAEEHADGGIVPSHAKGTKRIKPGVALTGEEGPELVWNKQGGYAYLVGKHGPEFANLVPGDLVFPADETKSIFKRGITPSLARGGKIVPAYAEGSWPDDGEDSGGKKKKKKETAGAKLNLDKYYNLVEDINELLRLRNLLEKDYELLLKTEGKTGKLIYDNLTRLLNLLEKRRKIVEDLALKRKLLILDLMKENKEYANYAWWNDEDQTIEIDWDAVQKIKDKSTATAVKEYLSKLEDFLGKYDDMIELLEEIESLTQEIKERGKEEYKSLEDRVRDALIKQIQDKIDELLAVDEAINETNQKLFDSISQTLELQRQERTNKKTEEELSDKEKRLAYLLQDSSNANAVEIAQLQKELADARQDYTDNLIDQKISELQRLNDEAQELRLQLIELMQLSLDWQEKNGEFWQLVYSLMSAGIDSSGVLISGSLLENLLKAGEGWDNLSSFLKMDWLKSLETLVALAVGFLSLNRLLEDLGVKEGTQITFTNSEGLILTGTVDKNGNVVVKNPEGGTTTYTGVYLDYAGHYRTVEDTPGPDKTEAETPEEPPAKEYTYRLCSKKKDKPIYHWRISKVDGKEVKELEEHDFDKDGVCTKCKYKKKKKSGKTGTDDTTPEGGEGTTPEKPGKPSRTGTETPEKPGSTGTETPEKPDGADDSYELVKTSYRQINDKIHEKIEIYQNKNGDIELKLSEEPHAFDSRGFCGKCGYTKGDRYDTDPLRPEEHPDDYTAEPEESLTTGGTPGKTPDSYETGPHKPLEHPDNTEHWVLISTDYKSINKKLHIKKLCYKERSSLIEKEEEYKEDHVWKWPLKKECKYCGEKNPDYTPLNVPDTETGFSGSTSGDAVNPQGDTTGGNPSEGVKPPNYKWIKKTEYQSLGALKHTKYNYSYKIDDNNEIIAKRLDSSATEDHNWLGKSCTKCGEINPNYKEPENPVHGPIGPGGGSGVPGRPGDISTRNFTAFSPDEVLSSRDSDAFMYLTDVYSNASKSNLTGTMNGGDNYYDIKVQVDSLGSDYDVDKAIDRIKARIAQENAYRNVNTLSRLR